MSIQKYNSDLDLQSKAAAMMVGFLGGLTFGIFKFSGADNSHLAAGVIWGIIIAIIVSLIIGWIYVSIPANWGYIFTIILIILFICMIVNLHKIQIPHFWIPS